MASPTDEGRTLPQTSDDINTQRMGSIHSMQELDPSPVHEELSQTESGNGNRFAKTQGSLSSQPSSSTGRSSALNLGLSGCNWDSWCKLTWTLYSLIPRVG